ARRVTGLLAGCEITGAGHQLCLTRVPPCSHSAGYSVCCVDVAGLSRARPWTTRRDRTRSKTCSISSRRGMTSFGERPGTDGRIPATLTPDINFIIESGREFRHSTDIGASSSCYPGLAALISVHDIELRYCASRSMHDRDLYSGLIRLHILHHACEDP